MTIFCLLYYITVHFWDQSLKHYCYQNHVIMNSVRYDFLGLFGSRQKLLLAKSGDPDQMPHYATSDLGLDCLPM